MADAEVAVSAMERIESWLNEHAPRLATKLGRAATESAISGIERKLRVTLPDDLKALYRWHNGAPNSGLFPSSAQNEKGYSPLRVGEVVPAHEHLTDLYILLNEDMQPKADRGIVRAMVTFGWIPIAKRGARDYLCVDLEPDKGGSHGQVIEVVWKSQRRRVTSTLAEFLDEVAEGLASGTYAVQSSRGLVLTRARSRRSRQKKPAIKPPTRTTKTEISIEFEPREDQEYEDERGYARVDASFRDMTAHVAKTFEKSFKKRCARIDCDWWPKNKLEKDYKWVGEIFAVTEDSELPRELERWLMDQGLKCDGGVGISKRGPIQIMSVTVFVAK